MIPGGVEPGRPNRLLTRPVRPVSTLVTTWVAVSDTMEAAVPPKLTLVARPG